jgi:hypothetical protein
MVTRGLEARIVKPEEEQLLGQSSVITVMTAVTD